MKLWKQLVYLIGMCVIVALAVQGVFSFFGIVPLGKTLTIVVQGVEKGQLKEYQFNTKSWINIQGGDTVVSFKDDKGTWTQIYLAGNTLNMVDVK